MRVCSIELDHYLVDRMRNSRGLDRVMPDRNESKVEKCKISEIERAFSLTRLFAGADLLDSG